MQVQEIINIFPPGMDIKKVQERIKIFPPGMDIKKVQERIKIFSWVWRVRWYRRENKDIRLGMES
jgi:hypothetical protein